MTDEKYIKQGLEYKCSQTYISVIEFASIYMSDQQLKYFLVVWPKVNWNNSIAELETDSVLFVIEFNLYWQWHLETLTNVLE